MSIEFNHQTKEWSVLSVTKQLMNLDHMEALQELLDSLLNKG
ncbi:hypothetical protein PP175_25680 (plasmid) [Aneurinibacillus sp. Ricciae_BoGa-3]|nr:hypothetical protein [Aneurinibacillus sp. Ricciae_BoGa-3]WCK57460.1 hypothetical protein PP175_25680 [Aneurinibacillus sp. Ricciae_BoGa-3]